MAMQKLDDDSLERIAVTELLGEAKRGKERYNSMGVTGWLKPKVPCTNKRFLERTLKSTKVVLKKSYPKEKTDPLDRSPYRKTETEIRHQSHDKAHHSTGPSRSTHNKAYKRDKMSLSKKYRSAASSSTSDHPSHKEQKVVRDYREKGGDSKYRKELKSLSSAVDVGESRDRKRHRHRPEDRKYDKFHRSGKKTVKSPSLREEYRYKKKR